MPRATDPTMEVIRQQAVAGHILLSLGPPPGHPFFRIRWNAARRRMQIGLRKLAAVPVDGGFLLPDPPGPEALAALSRLDRHLGEILYPRLGAAAVEGILGLTPAERRAWSDGARLPLAEHTVGRRGGRSWRFPTWDGRAVAVLAERPELIEAWRRQDAAGARPE